MCADHTCSFPFMKHVYTFIFQISFSPLSQVFLTRIFAMHSLPVLYHTMLSSISLLFSLLLSSQTLLLDVHILFLVLVHLQMLVLYPSVLVSFLDFYCIILNMILKLFVFKTDAYVSKKSIPCCC